MSGLSFAVLGNMAAVRTAAGVLAQVPSGGVARGGLAVGPLSFVPGSQQAWQQLLAPATGEARRVAITSAACLYADNGGSSPMQIGVGAAGAEVVVATLDRRGANDPYLPEVPIVIPAGMRIAVRFRDTWGSGTNPVYVSLAYLQDVL